MARPNPLTPFARILGADARLAAWQARAQHEQALTLVVRRQIPRALALRVRVTEAGDRALTLTAEAGAMAAVLRQRGPAILADLQREGWQFTELRVRVQVRGAAGPPPKPISNQRDAVNPQALNDLARTLPEGPLRAAVERLARRGGSIKP